MKNEELIDVDVDLDDEIYDRIVKYLGTEDPDIISKWISESLTIMFNEYIDKEKDL